MSACGRRSSKGITLIELAVTLAIIGIIAAISAPSVTALRGSLLQDGGARRLALILRAAQARAQAQETLVRVTVSADGAYTVATVADATRPPALLRPVDAGHLEVRVTSNYPQGSIEFGPQGWPRAAGSPSPRAGTFMVGDRRRVIVQLGGCIRCR